MTPAPPPLPPWKFSENSFDLVQPPLPFALVCFIKELCSLNISSLLWLIKLQLCICNISTFSRIQGCDKDDGPDEGHQQIFRGEKNDNSNRLRINPVCRWTGFMGGSSQITSRREQLFRLTQKLILSQILCIPTWNSQLLSTKKASIYQFSFHVNTFKKSSFIAQRIEIRYYKKLPILRGCAHIT